MRKESYRSLKGTTYKMTPHSEPLDHLELSTTLPCSYEDLALKKYENTGLLLNFTERAKMKNVAESAEKKIEVFIMERERLTNAYEEWMAKQPPSEVDSLPSINELLAIEPVYSQLIERVVQLKLSSRTAESMTKLMRSSYVKRQATEVTRGLQNTFKNKHPVAQASRDESPDEVEGYPDLIDQLPHMIASWQHKTKIHYLSMLPQADYSSISDFRRLELATSTFICVPCTESELVKFKKQPKDFTSKLIFLHPTLVVGWRSLSGHSACPHYIENWGLDIRYSCVGAEAAQSLVYLLGRSPGTTTADELDEQDYRFTCASCSIGPTGHRGYRGHQALTWKECVCINFRITTPWWW